MTRSAALEFLLRPIDINVLLTINARRREVKERHKAVAAAYPFLTKEEKERADQWREKERHAKLWKQLDLLKLS